MSATKPILDSVLAHLQAALPHYAIQLFPDNPAQYRFVHPLGAVLIGYQGSEFKELRDVDLIAQERRISLHFTVFGRGLNSDGAALDLLDALRLAIVGFRPENCERIHLLGERFLDETAGAWQYELRAQTETMQVENRIEPNRPKLTAAFYRRPDQPLNPNLKPK